MTTTESVAVIRFPQSSQAGRRPADGTTRRKGREHP
jgi:hypothetical protein